MTITEFLLARIAEDEEDAGWAEHGEVRWEGDEDTLRFLDRAPARVLAECQAKRALIERETQRWTLNPPPNVTITYSSDGLVTTVDGRPVNPDIGAQLMAAWTQPTTDTPTLRILAAVYASHPDYDEAWRP